MVRQRGSSARNLMARATVAVAALALLAGVNLAAAQEGAERYEVTITPPKRPGTQAPVAEADEAAAASDTAPEAPPVDPADNVLGGEPAGADAAQAPAAPAAKAAVPSGAAPTPATTRAATNLPLRTLQVGAYRLKKSAQSMREKLAASFEDVSIVEVQSGGESLYRVNVGRLPRGPALEALRGRLVAAGHPAFDVPLPPVAAGN
ncbi:MAG: SPOR domain-containing protein [Candidatus Binatia bacterium]